MSYREIHDRAEAVLLAMVAEGRAELLAQRPSGPVFRANLDEAIDRMGDAGLVGDTVPWPLTVRAVLALVEVRT
jgi:hypothetical protein